MFAALAGTVTVGGMEEPVVTPEVIDEEVTAGSSTGNLIIPLLAFILIDASSSIEFNFYILKNLKTSPA